MIGETIVYIGFSIALIGVVVYFFVVSEKNKLAKELNDYDLAISKMKKWITVARCIKNGGIAVAFIGLAIAYFEN